MMNSRYLCCKPSSTRTCLFVCLFSLWELVNKNLYGGKKHLLLLLFL